MRLSKTQTVIAVILFVLLVDQVLKIYIKTHFQIGEQLDILGLSWAKLYFIENEGMAFGITFGEKCIGKTVDGACKGILLSNFTAKLILSVFRIGLVGFLIYLLRAFIKANESKGLLISFSLIIAGAIGNILDSAFYGLLFSASTYHGGVAEFLPEGGGYAGFLHGNVVDMLYFPMIDTVLPEWFPFKGGDRFQFFRPIFNIADSAISIGVACIILFHRKLFKNENPKTEVDSTKS